MTGAVADPRHVVVLGAGPGLGLAVARRFGREGFAVTLVARHDAGLAALARELCDADVEVDTAATDSRTPTGSAPRSRRWRAAAPRAS